MILSTDAGKAFDKLQNPFLIKTLNILGVEEPYLNTVKGIYEKPTAHSILSDEKNESFSSNGKNNAKMPTLATSSKHSTGSL